MSTAFLRACADACIGTDGEPITPLEAAYLRAHVDVMMKDKDARTRARGSRTARVRAMKSVPREVQHILVREVACSICAEKMLVVSPIADRACLTCHSRIPYGSYDIPTRMEQIAQLLAHNGFPIVLSAARDSLLLNVGGWMIFTSSSFIIDDSISIDANLFCVAIQFPLCVYRIADLFVRVAQKFANIARNIAAFSPTLTPEEQARLIREM